MVTNKKFKMINTAQKVVKEQLERQAIAEARILEIQGGDEKGVELFLENIADLLGKLTAMVGAGKDPMANLDPRAKQMLVRMVAGAKILRDNPDVLPAMNLDSNKLRDIMARVGQKDANAQLASIGDSSPSVENSVQQMFQDYQQALSSGRPEAAAAIKQELNKLNMHWQQTLNKLRAKAPLGMIQPNPKMLKPGPTSGDDAHLMMKPSNVKGQQNPPYPPRQ